MIAEHDDDASAGARRLGLELLEAADDKERVRLAVGDVAKLDERRLAARPMARRVDQPGGAGDRLPGLEVAVEIADGDDAVRLRRPKAAGVTKNADTASATSAMRIDRSSAVASVRRSRIRAPHRPAACQHGRAARRQCR